MRTAYCPNTHRELAKTSKGEKYGHVPGHNYHDVDVVISQSRDGKFRCHIVESWGSAQGNYDQEHGRIEATGRGETIEAAANEAKEAHIAIAGHLIELEAGMETSYLAQAVAKAIDEATEEAGKPHPHTAIATVDDANFDDCTKTGYRWQLYGDGHVVATYNSRWQGSTDGARYVTEAGWVDLSELDESDPDKNAEALLTLAIADIDPSDPISDFRCTRRGTVVR